MDMMKGALAVATVHVQRCTAGLEKRRPCSWWHRQGGTCPLLSHPSEKHGPHSATLAGKPFDPEGVAEAVEHVRGLIQQEVEAGIPLNRIVVGGFSQVGGLLLSVCGLR